MKYTKPTLEILQLETVDIITASNQGSITANNITITGPKDDFSWDFGDLVRQ